MNLEQRIADLELENLAAQSLIADLLARIDADSAESLIAEIVTAAEC